MVDQMAQSTKKKRFSKKSKESWRKRIDISDVNNFLDDQRQQERIGYVQSFRLSFTLM